MPATRSRASKQTNQAQYQPFDVSSYLARRERGQALSKYCASRALATALPGQLVEHELQYVYKHEPDKAFCSAWLDSDRVLVGTKCNQLFEVNHRTRSQRSVPLPAAPAASAQRRRSEHAPCGQHAVAVSPNGMLVAAGGKCVDDAIVLRSDTLQPVQTCVGHADWVFGIAWTTDQHFVTASRDCTMKLWQVNDDGKYQQAPSRCMVSVKAHTSKVRDVKYQAQKGRLVSLGVAGQINTWSPALKPISSHMAPYQDDVVCLATSGSLVAVGSQHHVAVIDTNSNKLAYAIHLGEGAGARSVLFRDHMLSYGTGSGVMAFTDLRSVKKEGSLKVPAEVAEMELGAGRLCSENEYRHIFVLRELVNACYTHSWDPSGTRIFAAGGPLMFGLRGCYMALWQ